MSSVEVLPVALWGGGHQHWDLWEQHVTLDVMTAHNLFKSQTFHFLALIFIYGTFRNAQGKKTEVDAFLIAVDGQHGSLKPIDSIRVKVKSSKLSCRILSHQHGS